MEHSPASRPPETPEVEVRRVRRQRKVVAGLLLTLAGLFLIIGTLPIAVGALVRVLPVAGAGILALWVGGILMGNGMGKLSRRRR
jgi:hypothetical protein